MRDQPAARESRQFSQLPTGENIADYEGSKTWSNKQWAWEFLRRNKRYQERCAQLEGEKTPSKNRNTSIRKEFGLLDYKPFWEPFKDHGVKSPRFVTAQIQSWSRITKKQQEIRTREPRAYVRLGDVLIRFNVRAIEKSRKAIDAQLRDARTLLERRSEQWLKRKECDAGIKSRLKGDLLCYLRLLDLIAYNDSLPTDKRKLRSQLFVTIYGTDEERQRIDDVKASDHSDPLQRRKETAESYANDRYLDLAAS